jgi:long-chain acyl-CoA synthetase
MASLRKGVGEDPMQSAETMLPLERLSAWVSLTPDAIYLRQSSHGGWTDYTWSQVSDQARRIGAALRSQNLPPNSRIGILSKNCVQWVIADLAIMMAGHISTPLFTTMNAESIRYCMELCDIQQLFIGETDGWDSVKEVIPELIKTIALSHSSQVNPDFHWDRWLAEYEPLPLIPQHKSDDLWTIIFTSGTTGMPKGVCQSFGSWSTAARAYAQVYRSSQRSRFLSFLPLAHGAERVFVWLHSLYSGGVLHFNNNQDSFNDDMRAARPTFFFAVPRIYAKFQEAIQARYAADELPYLLSSASRSAQVRGDVQQQLGLDATDVAVIGAAPASESLHEWYESIGVPLCEGWGQSEVLACSANTPWSRRKGSVGKVMPGCQIRIGDNDEILVKNGAMMQGYWNDKESTGKALREGWVYTGDCGSLDADGFLTLTGRIKEIFKTAKGKYIAPMSIESHFAGYSYFEQTCLVGDGLAQPVLFSVLSASALEENPSLLTKKLEAVLTQTNKKLAKHERISHWLLIKDPWSAENGLLTHTSKIKRAAVEKHYHKILDRIIEGRIVPGINWK